LLKKFVIPAMIGTKKSYRASAAVAVFHNQQKRSLY